ncbi:hypothetical protein PQR02_28985 [Paraburkholderia sediminicola]|uniref:Uncharacterized protein n=1 Tax=Paraburkholderia rhynchosiae TaxID=487049 RepID=A0ACC7NID6_9BURK
MNFDLTGNLQSVSSRFPGWIQPMIAARDAAHRILSVSLDEFNTDTLYDSRGRVTNFRIFANALPVTGNVKRTLRVEYAYSPDGKVISRTGTLETNNGAPTAISSAAIDQWLNNYENGVTPVVPAANLAESSNGVVSLTEIHPVCVECYMNAKSWPVAGPDARALYSPRTGQLTGGGPVGITNSSLVSAPPTYSALDAIAAGGMMKCNDNGCAAEKAACIETCARAATDFNQPHVWTGKFSTCMRSCMPARCGGF